MKTFLLELLVLLCLLFVVCGSDLSYAKTTRSSPKSSGGKTAKKADGKNGSKAGVAVNAFPRFFEENKGQAPVGVRFLSRGRNYNLLLTANQASFQIPDDRCRKLRNEPPATAARKNSKQNSKPCESISLQMRMLDANRDVEVLGADALEAKSDYYTGADESRWQRGVSNFNQVRYRNLYEGIDAVFRGAEQNLEYDFHVAPGADPKLIKLEFDGAQKIRLDKNGDLIFKFAGVELRHRQPTAYQIIDGERREISAGFVLSNKNKIAFRLGSYDASHELIIDPIVYASYIGGTAGGDSVNDIAVDANGNIYTATDARFNFPQPDGAIYTYSDILITKFNPAGNVPLYFKYIGGTHDDVPYGIDVDPDGKVLITGITWSPDFPLHFPEQSTHPIVELDRDYTGFFIRLYADGDIQHSTYLGGNCPDEYGQGVVSDSNGNAYVTGYTCSSNFATHNGFQNSLQGSFNAFLVKYDGFGHITYGTLFGTNITDGGDVFNDSNGHTYIAGSLGNNSSVYTTPGAYSTTGTGFVAKFNTNATGAQSLVFSTRIPKYTTAIAVDSSGNSWVAMSRQGVASFDTALIIKLNNLGTQLLVQPQAHGNAVTDLAVDSLGSVYFASNYYTLNTQIATMVKGLRSDGTLINSYEINTSQNERTFGVALGPEPDIIYIGGNTNAQDFPTTVNAYQRYSNTQTIWGQGFFAKVTMDTAERLPLIIIPGIAGSELHEADVNGNPGENLWPSGLFQPVNPLAPTKLKRLSLNPNNPPYPGNPNNPFAEVVPVDILRKISFLNREEHFYGLFLDFLLDNGYPIQSKGCQPNTGGNAPELFIFTYDWRLSNAESAAKLKNLIDCVRTYYPNKKVNVLTHSMGGLVARRYILNHQNDHHIDKLITTVAPWLGAPKALDAVLTGRFLPGGDYFALYPARIRDITQHGAGPQELLPTVPYFTLAGSPFIYRKSDSQYEIFTYPQAYDFINREIPSQPYLNNANFHQSAQDNWSGDTTGIKYYHFYGVKNCNDTIGAILVEPRVSIPLPTSNTRIRFSVTTNAEAEGDGTVPRQSAERTPSMLAPTTEMNRLMKPPPEAGCAQDENYEHNGILQNPALRADILSILHGTAGSSPTAQNTVDIRDDRKAESSNLTGDGSMNYLDITGVDRLEITDDQGNANTSLGAVDKPIPGIGYEYGSEAGSQLAYPHEVKFLSGKAVEVRFLATADSITIKNMKGFGRNNSLETIKYLDLQLPVGVMARLNFTASGIENLRYDADGDGTFETEVQPSFTLTGTAANDKTPPTLNVSYTISNNTATVTASAADNQTGIKQIRYAVNGINGDHVYSAPFTVDLSQSQLIYVCAEDNAGNRSLVVKWLDASAPNTSVNQTPPANSVGWNTSDITLELKAVDGVGASGVQSFTYSGIGAQPISETTLTANDSAFAIPSPNGSTDFLAKTFNFHTEGVTTLTFSAKDRAGNIEATKTHLVKIDKSDPISQHSLINDGQQTTFTLTASDAVSGVSEIVYSIDGGGAQVYSAPFSVSNTGGHYVTFYARDLAGNEEARHAIYINAAQVAKSVLISEFRTRGYNGADDEFIELYNNSDTEIDISGWSINVKHGSASTPTALATINSGTVIPARGHYLLRKAGASNYSLSAYAEADQTYTGAMGDNVGIALFSTASIIIDAVGFSGVTDTTYREGTALAPSAGISTNGQYSFVRNYNGRGFPVDSNSNRADFTFVATDAATYNNLKAVLGSPGPENLSSPVYRSGAVLISQIDKKITLAEAPNRVYDYATTSVQYPVGILSIRRKLTNNTGGTITGLKLRITAVTTKNSAATFPVQAVLRQINSSDISVTSADGQTTIPLKGLTIEAVQPAVDGGLNTSLTLDLGANGLANGDSLNIDLKSGIVSNGQYRLEFRAEAIITAP